MDFAGGTYRVAFPSNVTMATIEIDVKEDLLIEEIEEFRVMIVDPGDGTIILGDPSTAIVNITDDTSKDVWLMLVRKLIVKVYA